ncbi:hypothetical protein ABL78_4158 [Leptomonas seymouri]|uniref:non-specific serine/threonine protein kinase n=1 Tax=Leptomonas seymouri TaxID=5684 RepID=A0A0N0P5S0_LEPSE|nr:hypothetical protein ABL78_4158 [Leptomonas seymouri]|eukprot:KPI86789.1 hypothetical protein ABL78_4158 [Leptomonas seymouri]
MLTDSSKYLRCAKKNAKECFYNLKAMSCVNCRLTTTNFTSSSVLFPKLSALNLSSNPFTSFDFRETPGSVSTLQISHVQLKESSVTEVLSLLPKSIKKLNISYSGLDFEWSMLKNGWPNMDMLDLSGLVPRAAISERRLGEGAVAAQKPLSSICDHAAGKSIKELHVSNCSLAGELPDFTNCEHLEVLDMSQNLFSTLRLDKFPPGLRGLNLRGNNFSNVLNVSQLPQRLLSLDLSKNRLHGTISTASLPPQISYFDISHNAFSGTLNLTELPETARFVYLQYNNFTGEAELSDIPLGIRFIMIHHNNWDCRMPAP